MQPCRLKIYTIWLFTFSDLKTIVGPSSAFGLLHALAASVFDIHPSPTWLAIVSRAPSVVFWTWLNLLPFTINNQRQPEAIDEDSVNKPWRPMPAKKITPLEAEQVIFVFRSVSFIASIYLGGIPQFFVLVLLDYWYNSWKGADSNCVIRNFINACGFVCYSSGAMEVAVGPPLSFQPTLVVWFIIIAAVIFSTVQTQDMYDQAGDKLRRRRTLPLVIGDTWSRWSIALPMLFWSCFVPWFWQSRFAEYVGSVILGTSVVYRTLSKRRVEDDKVTFRIWNAWLVSLYLLPFLRHYGSLR